MHSYHQNIPPKISVNTTNKMSNRTGTQPEKDGAYIDDPDSRGQKKIAISRITTTTI